MNKLIYYMIAGTAIFLLSAVSLFVVYVVADDNQNVIDMKNRIDNFKNEIKNQESLVTLIENERQYWEDNVKNREIELENAEKVEKNAKQIHDEVLREVIKDTADIEKERQAKAVLDEATNLRIQAESNLEIAKKDLANHIIKLRAEQKKLKDMNDLLPDLEIEFEKLKKVANKARLLPSTSGQLKSIFISIILSDECMISDHCPTYKELADIYDNSNRFISGEFYLENNTKIYKGIYEPVYCYGNCSFENGTKTKKVGDYEIKIWKRGKPTFQNDLEWYRYAGMEVVTFVDPNDYTRERSKQIYIEPLIAEFLNRGESGKLSKMDSFTMKNNTRITHVDFDMIGCDKATIGWANDGRELLADIVSYFYSNCSDILDRNNTKITYKEPTLFTDCGKWCQHMNWVKESLNKSKEYLIPK